MEEGLEPPSCKSVIARWRRHREAEEAAQAEEAGAAVAQPDRPAETAVARSPSPERRLAHAGHSPDYPSGQRGRVPQLGAQARLRSVRDRSDVPAPRRAAVGRHVERVIRTLMERLKALPGATGNSVTDHKGRDPEKTAAMTLEEYERWIVLEVAQRYVQFMPLARRSIQRDGLSIHSPAVLASEYRRLVPVTAQDVGPVSPGGSVPGLHVGRRLQQSMSSAGSSIARRETRRVRRDGDGEKSSSLPRPSSRGLFRWI